VPWIGIKFGLYCVECIITLIESAKVVSSAKTETFAKAAENPLVALHLSLHDSSFSFKA